MLGFGLSRRKPYHHCLGHRREQTLSSFCEEIDAVAGVERLGWAPTPPKSKLLIFNLCRPSNFHEEAKMSSSGMALGRRKPCHCRASHRQEQTPSSFREGTNIVEMKTLS